MIKENNNLYICSDGGAKYNIGSFGAVIATNKEIMIKVSEQEYGKTPRSFRVHQVPQHKNEIKTENIQWQRRSNNKDTTNQGYQNDLTKKKHALKEWCEASNTRHAVTLTIWYDITPCDRTPRQ